MSGFFTMQAIIMLLIGVFASTMIKGFFGRAKSTVTGG